MPSIPFLACLVWPFLAIWIVSLINWTIVADVDVVTGLFGVATALILGFLTLKPPIPIVSPICFTLVVGTIFFFPFVRAAVDRKQLKSIDIENIERAYEALGQRPDNPLAKMKLARTIYRLGLTGHAVAIADSVLAYIPERVLLEEHQELKKWKRIGVPPESLRPIQCVECHTMCEPGWTHCRNCGSPFLLDRVKGRVLGTGMGRRLIAVWVGLVALTAGIPAATALAPIASIVVILLILAAAVALLVLAFRNPEGAPT